MDGPIIGVICFFGIVTLFFLFRIYVNTIHTQRQVWLIAKHLGLDPTKAMELSDRVKEVARDSSRKIEAIKLHREETGAGLAEAKAAVEAYVRSLNQ